MVEHYHVRCGNHWSGVLRQHANVPDAATWAACTGQISRRVVEIVRSFYQQNEATITTKLHMKNSQQGDGYCLLFSHEVDANTAATTNPIANMM